MLFRGSFSTNSAKFCKSDAVKFWLEILKRLRQQVFHKSNCGRQFYAIQSHQTNKQSSMNIKIESMLQRFSCISYLLKPPWLQKRLFYVKLSDLAYEIIGRISKLCVSRGRKCLFSRKFSVLCFLVTSILRFALLFYYRQQVMKH